MPPITLRMDEFSVPAGAAEQLRVDLAERSGKDSPQKLMSDLADRLISPRPIQVVLGTAIPIR